MKKSLYISILMVAAALFSSCERGGESDFSWDDSWNTFNGYMQFSTVVSTRADKAVNMRGRNFGVLGYQYSGTSNWNTAQALATPNTFYNQKVECGADGICTYDIDPNQADNQLEKWEDNSRYAFFAYHPHGGSGISLSNNTTIGIPYLTYKYGWLKDANEGTTINVCTDNRFFDLMTAEDIDCDGSKNVKFNFKHRLFAIEVLANNYNENEYQYEYEKDDSGNIRYNEAGEPIIKRDEKGDKIFALDENGEKILLKNHSQAISDLTLRIKGLHRIGMTIPMKDYSKEEFESKTTYIEGTVGNEENVVALTISNQKVEIPAFDVTITDEDGTIRGGGYASSISKLGSNGSKGYVMLIPQSGELDFALNWTWEKNDTEFKPENVTNNLKSTMQFEAGRLYQLIINFVGSGVTIALIEAGSWDPKDVYYTFE